MSSANQNRHHMPRKECFYLAYDSQNSLLLDLDNTTHHNAVTTAERLRPQFGSYCIVRTSKGNHAAVFDNKMPAKKIEAALRKHSPSQHYSFRKRGHMALRIGWKNGKRPPWIVSFRTQGAFRHGVRKYLDVLDSVADLVQCGNFKKVGKRRRAFRSGETLCLPTN